MRPRRTLHTLLTIPLLTLLALNPHLAYIPKTHATANYNVAIQAESFNPPATTIHNGDTIIWANNDPLIYELYFQNSDGSAYALSPFLNPGDTYTLTGFKQCTSLTYTTINSQVTIIGTIRILLQGDVNGDGKVNIFDLVAVGSAFGAVLGNPNYNPAADLNNDGIINIFDLTLVGSNFGATC